MIHFDVSKLKADIRTCAFRNDATARISNGFIHISNTMNSGAMQSDMYAALIAGIKQLEGNEFKDVFSVPIAKRLNPPCKPIDSHGHNKYYKKYLA